MGEPNLSGGIEVDPKQLTHPTLAFLRRWWDDKRGTRAMPARADIRPADMKQHLSWLVLLEVVDGGRDFRYRVIGDDVAEYFNWNATGKTVTDAWAMQPKSVCDVVLAVDRGVIANRVPTYAFANSGWAMQGIEHCECLYVPLSDNGDSVDYLLHAFVFNRREVHLARQIARNNGGELPARA